MEGVDEILDVDSAFDGLVDWVKKVKANKTNIKFPRYDLALAITR